MSVFKKILSCQKWQQFPIFEFFVKIAKHKNAYISKTMLDRPISPKFLNHRVSLQSSHANFQKKFVFAKMAKYKNACMSKTMLDRADYANFGCHNSIRLEAEHFLNTLALTFISFLGRGDSKNIIFFFCKRSSSLYLRLKIERSSHCFHLKAVTT